MKYLFLLGIPLFLISCGDNKSALNIDSLKTDSILRSQLTVKSTDTAAPAKDTAKSEVLPDVFEGDIVMQISEDANHLAFGKACGSKYNHAGVIFIRPKDRMYIVMEANDTVTALPLREWATRGQGKHIVVMRLKNSNEVLTDKKTAALKKGAKDFRGKKEDVAYSWDDSAFYSTELAWKVYQKALGIEICEPGKLGDIKYGGAAQAEEKFISPDAIYKSPKLMIVYER
jgi:hypothetical protein